METNDNKNLTDKEIGNKPFIKKSLSFGVAVIIVFIGGFLIWAFFAPLESAAIAPGKITVAGKRRTIQHLEGGIVEKIYVKDGSKVKKGEVLVELDDVQAKIIYQLRLNEVYELKAIESRLTSMLNNLDQIQFDQRLLDNQKDKKVKEIIESQKSIFEETRKTYQGNINILNQRIQQLEQQIQGHQANVIATDKQIKLIQEEIESVKILEAKKLIEKYKLLALLREDAKLLGKKGELTANIAALNQKIGETKLEISKLQTTFRGEMLTELRETQQKLADALEKEKAAKTILERTIIHSPIDGVVVGLKIHTVGGVIRPGEDLMDIVPVKEDLIAEAEINPLDIDVVHPGLTAKVRLISFKVRTTPTLLGKVIHVSADAFTNEKTGKSYYLADVSIDKKELDKLQEGQSLYPGMPVQVLIITAKLTPFQYFILPIKSSFGRAFRED